MKPERLPQPDAIRKQLTWALREIRRIRSAFASKMYPGGGNLVEITPQIREELDHLASRYGRNKRTAAILQEMLESATTTTVTQDVTHHEEEQEDYGTE